MRGLIFLVLLLIGCSEYRSENTSFDPTKLDPGNLTAGAFSGLSPRQLEVVVDYAIALKQDSSTEKQVNGELMLAVLADDLKNDIDNSGVDISDLVLKRVLIKLEGQNYFVYRPRPSNIQKLLYHMREGHWTYIYDRAFVTLYSNAGLFVFVPLIIICAFGLYRRRSTRRNKEKIHQPQT